MFLRTKRLALVSSSSGLSVDVTLAAWKSAPESHALITRSCKVTPSVAGVSASSGAASGSSAASAGRAAVVEDAVDAKVELGQIELENAVFQQAQETALGCACLGGGHGGLSVRATGSSASARRWPVFRHRWRAGISARRRATSRTLRRHLACSAGRGRAPGLVACQAGQCSS